MLWSKGLFLGTGLRLLVDQGVTRHLTSTFILPVLDDLSLDGYADVSRALTPLQIWNVEGR